MTPFLGFCVSVWLDCVYFLRRVVVSCCPLLLVAGHWQQFTHQGGKKIRPKFWTKKQQKTNLLITCAWTLEWLVENIDNDRARRCSWSSSDNGEILCQFRRTTVTLQQSWWDPPNHISSPLKCLLRTDGYPECESGPYYYGTWRRRPPPPPPPPPPDDLIGLCFVMFFLFFFFALVFLLSWYSEPPPDDWADFIFNFVVVTVDA